MKQCVDLADWFSCCQNVSWWAADAIIEDEVLAEYLLYVQELGVSEETNSESENEQSPTINVTNKEENATMETRNARVYEGREGRELNVEEKRKIVEKLLCLSTNDKLPRGAITETSKEFKLHRTTVSRLWSRAMKDKQRGVGINVQSRKLGKVGAKMKTFSKEWYVPLHKRTIVRSFAGALRVSPSLIYRLLKRGCLRSHTSSNHPSVTPQHKLARMKWVLKHIQPGILD